MCANQAGLAGVVRMRAASTEAKLGKQRLVLVGVLLLLCSAFWKRCLYICISVSISVGILPSDMALSLPLVSP